MGKRRSNIITDKNDTRFFPEGSQDEGEQLDFSLNLTQASSLYIICVSALPELKAQVKQGRRKLANTKTYMTPEIQKDLTDTIFVLQEVIKDAETIKTEIAELINELS